MKIPAARAHTSSSSAHLRMQMIDNRHQLYVSFPTRTLPLRMLMIDRLRRRRHHHCFYLSVRVAAARGLSPPRIGLFLKCVLTTDVKTQSGQKLHESTLKPPSSTCNHTHTQRETSLY